MQSPVDETATGISCTNCGYNLTHLPPGECPECGKAFDPDDLRTVNRIRANKSTPARAVVHALTWLFLVGAIGSVVVIIITELFWPVLSWFIDS